MKVPSSQDLAVYTCVVVKGYSRECFGSLKLFLELSRCLSNKTGRENRTERSVRSRFGYTSTVQCGAKVNPQNNKGLHQLIGVRFLKTGLVKAMTVKLT